MSDVCWVQQARNQSAERPRLKAHPDWKRHDGQQQKYHGKPSAWTGQIHPSLERVRTGKDHMAGGGKHQRPLEHTDQKKQAEQLITEQRPAPRGEMSSPDPKVSEAMIAPGPKRVSHDAGFMNVNASNGFRHVLMVTLGALVSGDEAVIQAHVVGQRIHRSRANDVTAAAGV